MDYDDHIGVVELETSMLISAFRDASGGARVPTCPEFSLSDLAVHVGEFTALWTHVLCEAADTEKTTFAPLDDVEDMGAWYGPLADHLLDRLRATRGDAPCWMWIPDQQTAGSVARRCANELSIHRFDAQSAGANTSPLDDAAALDAIDEIFVMLPVWDNPPEGSGKSLGLCATEGAQRTITLGPEGPRIHGSTRSSGTPTSHSPAALPISRCSSSSDPRSDMCKATGTRA